jgi:hypothetical protein
MAIAPYVWRTREMGIVWQTVQEQRYTNRERKVSLSLSENISLILYLRTQFLRLLPDDNGSIPYSSLSPGLCGN